jgi:hypothetical protein
VISIQPMMTLLVLPSLGGHPYVWALMQCAFQSLLLVGYALAARLDRAGAPAWRLYGSGAAALGVLSWMAPTFDRELLSLTRALVPCIVVGLLFTALSMTSIAAQSVMRRLRPGSPAWLFAASNAGSVLAACLYPFLIEPRVDLDLQLRSWVRGAAALLVAIGCSVLLAVPRARFESAAAADRRPDPGARRSWGWFAGGAISVGLSLSSSAYLALDLGSHPIVWLGPFTAYLVSLILAFTARGRDLLRRIESAAPAAAVILILGISSRLLSLSGYGLHMAALFVLIARWNLWLYDHRPDDPDLPRFYTAMTLGGVTISAALSMFIPALIDQGLQAPSAPALTRAGLLPEYWLLTIIAAVAGWGGRAARGTGSPVRHALEGAVCGLVLLGLSDFVKGGSFARAAWHSGTTLLAAATLVAIAVFTRSRGHAMGALAVALVGTTVVGPHSQGMLIQQRRSAFGVLSVTESGGVRRPSHGTTLHGEEAVDCISGRAARDCQPSGYYHAQGPLGLLFESRRPDRPLRVGVVGLGVGTAAAYCEPGDDFRFYEINPQVIEVAQRMFGYLGRAQRRCGEIPILVSDARIQLRRERDGSFDVLVLDAFSSDSVPAHLITVQAVRDVGRLLGPRGVAGYHVSSRLFDLASLVVAAGREAGLASIAVWDRGSADRLSSHWVFLSADPALPLILETRLEGRRGDLRVTDARPTRPWTDYRRDFLAALR